MKNHVLRPLWLSLAIIALVLLVRSVVVPKDFGVHGHREDGRNFTFSFHRLGAIDDWKAVKVKYRGKKYCAECHDEKVEENLSSKHKNIQCENCHGPAIDHPDDPETLTVDRSRDLCLRCHSYLPYPGNRRSTMPAIDPLDHNPDEACADCHNPHKPNLEDME